MELLQLYYFKTVAEFQHVSKAAAYLHVAQPALSQTIKRLEQELDTRLFDRTGKGVVLNERGRILLKYADQVLSALDRARDEIAECCERAQKTLTISIRSASAPVFAMLPEFRDQYPDVELVIDQITARKTKRADIEIYSQREEPDDDHHCVLLQERMLLALPCNHRLAKKELLFLEDLAEEPFIKLGEDSRIQQVMEQNFREAGFHPKTSVFCDMDNLGTLLPLVEKNMGLTFIPEKTYIRRRENPSVVLREVSGQPFSRRIILSWNPEASKTKMIENFCRIAMDFFREL